MLARAADIEGYLNGGTFGPINIGATLTIGNYLATLVITNTATASAIEGAIARRQYQKIIETT